MGAPEEGRENLLRYSVFLFQSMGPRTRAPAASRSNCLMWRERSPGVRDGTPVPLLNNTLRGWSSLPVTITAA